MLSYSLAIFEMIHTGKMAENNTLTFEQDHPGATILYHPSLPTNPEREINSNLNGEVAEFINDPPYEKTKAQRILAKTAPASTAGQYTEEVTIGTSSSLSTLTGSNTDTIPVSTLTGFIIA